eukprot:PITA_15847
MSLAWIPRGILTRIQSLCCKFLWKGSMQGRTFAWVNWDALNLPKKWGGWGLEKLDDFSSALAAKLGSHLVVIKAIDPITVGITWRIHSGNKVCIDIDPWIGYGNMHRLPHELLHHLHNQNMTHIAHIVDDDNTTFLQQAWKTALHLHIPPQWARVWEDYTEALTKAHIRINEGDDEVIWALSKSGRYSPKDGYLALSEPRRLIAEWWRHL